MEKTNSKKGVFIVIGLILAVAILFGGYMGLKASGMFLSTPEKILQAVENTLEDKSPLEKALDYSDLLKSGKYSEEIVIGLNGYSVEAGVATDKKNKQAFVIANIPGINNLEAILNMDKSKVQLYAPFIIEGTFAYDYTKPMGGIIKYALGENVTDEDYKAFNDALKQIYEADFESAADTKKNKEDIKKLKSWYSTLEYEKASKETFVIDGKEVSCEGYSTTITSDNLCELIDIIKDTNAMKDYVENLNSLLKDTNSTPDVNIDDAFEEIKNNFASFPNMDVDIYIYKNKLAAVRFSVKEESETTTLDLIFEGGNYRTENWKLLMNGVALAKMEGSSDKNECSQKLYVTDKEFFSYNYNIKDGDLELSIPDVVNAKLNIEKTKKKLTVTLKNLDVTIEGIPSSYAKIISSIDFELTVKANGELKTLNPRGYNINDLDAVTLQEMAEEIQGNIKDLGEKFQALNDFDL